MQESLERELELRDRVITEFPSAIHATYLVGRDELPKNTLVFCNGRVMRGVAAFETGSKGWVIQTLPDGDGGLVLWHHRGNIRERKHY